MVQGKFIAAILMILVASRSLGQEHQHGNVEKLGTVHFATSCNEVAEKEFNRAVALLHSFQFRRAIEGFNTVLREDATCGIGYWGIALSDWSNPFAPGLKDKSQLQAGRESAERGRTVGAKTERERTYIAAVGKLYSNYENTPQRPRLIAYRDAMGDVAAKYQGDHEAQIFYALALAASEDPADKTYAGRLKAGAILEKLFEEEPTHPGLAHYIIHTYDVPALAGRALVAARRYSEIAPDAPHALHMPSHTFTRTGDWQESIDANLAAAASAKREGQTAEELHSSDYEIYAYLQTAQDEAAGRIVTTLPEIASRFDPKVVIGGAGGPSIGYFALAAIPARYALERQDWKQAAQLGLRETPFPYTDAMTWFARGLGAARLGQAATANESATALLEIREQLLKANENYWSRQVEIQQVAVGAWAALAAGKKDEALRQMKLAAELEDGTEKSAVTPGPLAPARELLGEMLLEMNQPAQALEQFEATLKKEPGRFRALYGAAHAAQLSGNRDASQKYFLDLLKVCVHADKPGRPELQSEVQTEPLKADEIMARVASNQDHIEALRQEYVYKQHIHIVTHKPGARMMREETADYDVAPQPGGIQKHLKSLTGRYWSKGKYVDFQGEQVPGSTDKDLVVYLRNQDPMPGGTDAELIHNLRNYVSNDNSKDGLSRALFPLTSEGLKNYEFKLLGQEVEAGRNVYHIAFTPRDEDKGEPMWSGEAFIDTAEFQPVRVFTRMSRRIPLLVRTTWFDLPGFGFNVSYKRQADGVWFPAIFGTEFQMHVGPLFFFNRDVSISMENSGFEHTREQTK